MFPRRYDLIARILLDEVGELTPQQIEGLTPEDKRSLLVQRSADRLAERFRFNAEGRSLEERVSGVTDVLHNIGGFAEWLRTQEGYEIRDYNCVFASLVDSSGECCEGHVRLITQLLKWPVRHETVIEGNVTCCRYVVSQEGDLQKQSDVTREGSFANA